MVNGTLKLRDGRQWLPEGVVREVLKALHEGGHWGVKALVSAFLQKYTGKKSVVTRQHHFSPLHSLPESK